VIVILERQSRRKRKGISVNNPGEDIALRRRRGRQIPNANKMIENVSQGKMWGKYK